MFNKMTWWIKKNHISVLLCSFIAILALDGKHDYTLSKVEKQQDRIWSLEKQVQILESRIEPIENLHKKQFEQIKKRQDRIKTRNSI